ncbi:MAG: type III-B CRISPR-associated protein Cas10/Cmr2 [Acidobacteria bacterium]|nr:type III-B CRISPR-associated protein Cas10/Cmr2 [Acidobacteriota bacterium]
MMKQAAAEVDRLASMIERLPMPTDGDSGERTVNPVGNQLGIVHPLARTRARLDVPDLTGEIVTQEQDQIREILTSIPGDQGQLERNQYFAIWRLFQEKLTETLGDFFGRLPADTRTPDHTIWHHLDITAGMKAAQADRDGAALLAVAIGPVQAFIEASRSVRDLWSSSMIVSWLAFRAMRPVIEQLGPTALVYPALRGNPLLDLWLRDGLHLKLPLPPKDLRLSPSLPHRFLALVPWGADGLEAKNLAVQCRNAVVASWQEMATHVRQSVAGALHPLWADWDKRWDTQIASYFSTSTCVVPMTGSGAELDECLARLLAGKDSFADAFKDAEAVRVMARSIPEGERKYSQDHAGRWQYQVELTARSLAAHRTVRQVPRNTANPGTDSRFPQKCTLLGSFEQMGPDELAKSRTFWDQVSRLDTGLSFDGVRIRNTEALCAVAMVKRFAAPVFLKDILGLDADDLRFSDTWTIAAAEWLSHAEKAGSKLGPKPMAAWNGQWLHWNTERDDPDEPRCLGAALEKIKTARSKLGKPPVYYAILKLDGDDLSGWLRGEKSPRVRDVMHPDLVRYYEELGEAAHAGLEAKRPVGPALHAAISTALANFALYAVPGIVAQHHGVTVYSGGDDTLVLLPAGQALGCAMELRKAFMSDYHAKGGRQHLMMGSRATLSGGLVVVHAKDDLRLALQDTRHAERKAKESGKDAMVITIRRRSGEHTSALCPWHFAPIVDKWTTAFRARASDRWAYRLYAYRQTLAGLPVEAIRAEMRRQISRSEEPTPNLIRPEDFTAGFDEFRESSFEIDNKQVRRFNSTAAALEQFLTLCHTASFLARGRDA